MGSCVPSLTGSTSKLGSQWPGGRGVSGGQWQRLSLARIFLRQSPIWILDELISAIDAEAEQEIFDALQQSKDQRITIMVSHRVWTLRNVDEIVVVDQGRVVERGMYDELISLGGNFIDMFAAQTGDPDHGSK